MEQLILDSENQTGFLVEKIDPTKEVHACNGRKFCIPLRQKMKKNLNVTLLKKKMLPAKNESPDSMAMMKWGTEEHWDWHCLERKCCQSRIFRLYGYDGMRNRRTLKWHCLERKCCQPRISRLYGQDEMRNRRTLKWHCLERKCCQPWISRLYGQDKRRTRRTLKLTLLRKKMLPAKNFQTLWPRWNEEQKRHSHIDLKS